MKNSNLSSDKKSILSETACKKSGSELAKRELERILGISYDEYKKMNTDERYKLIKKRTGKKVKPDHRLYIDGIPMDKNHIITRKQIDKRINESGPRKLLRKVLEPLKKNKF